MRKAVPTLHAPSKLNASLVVQSIHIEWTKETRGAGHAAVRNALPRALAVPDTVVFSPKARSTMSGCWHKVEYSWVDLFQSRGEHLIAYDPHRYGYAPGSVPGDSFCCLRTPVQVPLVLLLSETKIRVELWGPSLNLELDQYGRVVVNRRLSECGSGDHWPVWLFEQWVINIGLFSSPVRDCFTRRKPDREFIKLAGLYYNS